MSENSVGLKIIGAGFGRTGTHALKLALERLGFGPCHHMFEVRDNPRQLPAWEALARGEAVDWNSVFEGYNAQVDWPGARYWRQLSEHYPDAKIILTVRPAICWYESVETTIYPFISRFKTHGSDNLRKLAAMAFETIVQQVFQGRLSDRAYAIDVYRRHILEVQGTIAPERLLTFSVSEGWGPLCGFLNVATPDEPFPHTNQRTIFPR